MVELDLINTYAHVPGGPSFFRVWGIGLMTAIQAQQLGQSPSSGAGNTVMIRGGMGKGLPLANPAQAGLLVTGTLYQCFANWQGTNMTLEGYIVPLISQQQGDAQQPNAPLSSAMITFNWPANTPMGPAIQQALQAAYPGYTVTVNVSSKLVLPNQQGGTYQSFEDFADAVQGLSQPILGGNYGGVVMFLSTDGKTINVQDDTAMQATKAIMFNDMIGQVTWVNYNVVHVPMVMRGDLSVGQYISMPPGQVTTTSSSFANFRQSAAIKGSFYINKIRHVGNFREGSGLSWVTNVFAVNLPAATPSGNVTVENMTITSP